MIAPWAGMATPWRSAEPFQYADRRHAGAVLARQLQRFAGRHDVVVLALPRGGVPVAFEVAQSLGAPEPLERWGRHEVDLPETYPTGV